MKTSLLSIFVGLCFFSKVQVRGDDRLKERELAQITEQYGLTQSRYGDFLSSVTFEASTTIDLPSGTDLLGASYLLVFNGACKGWIMFPEVDRVYTRVSGKATIDLANLDGEITSVCLGDSLEDSNCVYTLIIPAGWKADIRPSGYIIYTGTTIGGSTANGGSVSFDTMREQYSNYTDLIDEVEANCS